MNTKNRSHIVWPSSTLNGEARTAPKMMEIVNKIEENGKLPPDEAKGVVGRSPLYMIPNFDIVSRVPTEYLHSTCLGVTKRTLELTFNVGDTRPRITKRKLSDTKLFNKEMTQVKVFRECSRRNRALDFAVLKGQEFRNILLFFFTIVVSCIEQGEKERQLWLLFAYVIRACVLPEKEFKSVELQDIEDSCKRCYKLYELLFGNYNCSYNTHIVFGHLLEMRFHGPLTFTSAFGFESFYGEIRSSFTPGTPSTLKQIFQKILMKRSLAYHRCQNSIFYSDHETQLENNTLIYCFSSKDRLHEIYKIYEVREEYVLAKKYGKYNQSFPETPTLNWAHVGVYKKGLLSDEKVKIMKENIDGKVMEVQNLFITCPNNILREK